LFFLSSSEKRLLQELEAAREARRAIERQREELVKKAKLMQNKTQNRRNVTVSKPHTHKHYMLTHCSNIVYISFIYL
jgi:single-stranded DNA-specific DHH superfamily exonuclease